jgi:hypothetical protein
MKKEQVVDQKLSQLADFPLLCAHSGKHTRKSLRSKDGLVFSPAHNPKIVSSKCDPRNRSPHSHAASEELNSVVRVVQTGPPNRTGG